jgi:hypothetical protein
MSRGLQLEKGFYCHPLPPYQDRLINRVDFLSACGDNITPLHLIRRELTSCTHFAGRPGKSHANVDVLFPFAYQAMFINANDITVLSLAGAGCIVVSVAIATLSKESKAPTCPPPNDVKVHANQHATISQDQNTT